MLKKEFKKNEAKIALEKLTRLSGLNDLLSYLMQLDDHLVLHKDGALSAHFSYLAPDLTSSMGDELDAHSDTWLHALSFLGDGWMIETNVISQPYVPVAASQEFPELVSAIINEERRLQFAQGNHFVTQYYLSISWKPDALLNTQLKHLDRDPSDAFVKQRLLFKQKITEVIGYLKRSININPLSGDELTTFLFQCINGGKQKLARANVGSFLDSYLSHQAFIAGFTPKIGEQYIKALAINDLPSMSYPSILESLNVLPFSYRWSTRFICMDPMTADRYLKAHERSWSSKAIGVMGVIRESMGLPVKLDEDASQQADAVRDAQIENNRGEIRYGFYNSTLILMDEDKDKLTTQAEEIANHIQRLNFKVRIETINACESYLGSLPCHGDYNLRKLLVDTRFVSHALPMSHLYKGELYCPCPLYGNQQPPLLMTSTTGNRPFLLNLHVGDVGHTAILGPTGSGKSTLIASIIVGHRQYLNSRIIILDKDNSHRNIIKSLEGHYIDLARGDDALSPLAALTKDNQKGLNQAQQWLSDSCEMQGIVMTPEWQLNLRDALLQLADEPPAYKNLNHLSLQSPELRVAIQSLNSGVFQKIMNGTESTLSDKNIIGFEMGGLLEHGHAASSVSIIQALFNELFLSFENKYPTLLVLEEGWNLLKHPIIAEKLTDWFKTLRKYNVSVIFVTQDLSDIANSSYAASIQNACMTRIYLPNSKANEPEVKNGYHAFGLNDTQIEIIQKAIPKKVYYYVSSLGSSLFELELGELAEAFFSIPDNEDFFDHCLASNTMSDWLRDKELHDWADYVEEVYSR